MKKAIKVKGIKFCYDEEELEITDDVMDDINDFIDSLEGSYDEEYDSFYMYKIDGNLIIY